MRTFYSILYSTLKSAIDEQVSIALFIIDETNVYFDFSNEKLKFLKNLLSSEIYSFIKAYLKGIQDNIEKIRSKMEQDKSFFPKNSDDLTYLKEGYFNYLNVYNNNLIRFSKPKQIDIELNEQVFKKLFNEFIFKEQLDSDNIEIEDRIEKIKKIYYPRIEQWVNTDFDIQNFDASLIKIPRAVLPKKIDLIGKNNDYISGQFINFELKTYNLEDTITRYLLFNKELGENGYSYIIADEPDKFNFSNQHKLWDEMRNYHSNVKLICNGEFEQVEDYLKEHDVKPIMELQPEN